MGVNEDKLDMLKGIFEEQRELTDDEMKVYKDMLRRKEEMMKMPWEEDKNWNNTATTLGKENDMGVIATESRFNQTVQKDQATLIAELISRVTSLENDMEYVRKHIRVLDGIIF